MPTPIGIGGSSPGTGRPWGLAIGTIATGAILLVWGRGATDVRPGTALSVKITIVPADAADLGCACAGVVGGQRCSFDENGHPATPAAVTLLPFRTTDSELLLLSGVFETSTVSAWRARMRPDDNTTRVTVECQTRVLGTVAFVGVRWQAAAPFGPATSVPAAEVIDSSEPWYDVATVDGADG